MDYWRALDDLLRSLEFKTTTFTCPMYLALDSGYLLRSEG